MRTAISIRALATNFIRASTPNQPLRKNDELWKRPMAGIVKVNVDASFRAETLSGGTGVVAHDDHGNFIAAAT